MQRIKELWKSINWYILMIMDKVMLTMIFEPEAK